MPLQIRRGPTANLPATPAEGEPLFNTTTSELLIGTGSGSVAMAKKVHTHPVGDIATTGGTASASTFLRGDGTWATPAGGGGASTPAGITFASPSKVLGSPQSGTTGTELSLTSQLSITGSNLDVVVAASGGLEKVSGLKIATGGVAEAMLASNAVTATKIADSAVTVAKLSATGTPSNSTYLRGDGTWAGSGTVTSITPAADTGTGTAITTNGSITVAGTANEVETSVSGTTVTVGLPSAITVTEVNVDRVDFNTGASAPADQPGREYWDSTWETISLGLDANVSLKHGQQLYIRGHNNTGTQIDRGKVVYLAGGHATTEALIELADADTENASSRTVGIAAENIGHGATGFVQVFGYISGLTTNGYTGTEGSALYLSSTAGDMTSTLPTQPKHGLRVGFIVKKAGPGAGSIFINIQNYQELDELSDVLISGQAEKDLLSWDHTASVWKNRTIAAAGVAAASHNHAASAITSGTLDIARIPRPGVLVPSTMSMTWSDFTGSSVVPWTSLTSGTGATVTFTQSGADDNPGLLTFSTGTTSTGRAGIGSGNTDAFVFGTRPHVFSTAVLIVSNLSTAADRFSIEAGFMDSLTGAFTNGAYFSYTDNVNGGQWLCTCSNGVGSTSENSGTTVATGTWYRLEIEVNAAGTSVVFKINGTQVANITNDIPTTTSNRLGIAVQQRKNGGTTGTTARSSRCDYLLHYSEVSR